MIKARPEPEGSVEGQTNPQLSFQQPLAVYHLSHDLRGPLNSILGFSELLLEGIEGPLNENQEADITAIYQSAQNLLRLINTLVDLSKLEVGRLNFDFQAVNLHPVIDNIMAFDFGQNKSEQVEFISQVIEPLPPVWGDQERIEQMVMNLIRFVFKRQKEGQIVLAAESNDQAVTLQIHNQITLSAEEVTQLFELEVNIDSTGRSKLGPGGLELPLTQGLVEKHQGQVGVERQEGSGTIFYLKLPIYDSSTQGLN